MRAHLNGSFLVLVTPIDETSTKCWIVDGKVDTKLRTPSQSRSKQEVILEIICKEKKTTKGSFCKTQQSKLITSQGKKKRDDFFVTVCKYVVKSYNARVPVSQIIKTKPSIGTV
jgi:hypothetical protein